VGLGGEEGREINEWFVCNFFLLYYHRMHYSRLKRIGAGGVS